MSVIDDYKERGGLAGIAKSKLQQQLGLAISNAAHPLRRVIEAKDADMATKLLLEALDEYDGQDDDLKMIKTAFLTLPVTALSVEFLAKNIDHENERDKVLSLTVSKSEKERLLILGAMQAQQDYVDATVSKRQSENASNPRKKLPTKEKLDTLKKEFEDDYEKKHGKRVTRGWITYAREKLLKEYGSIDYKTINTIRNDEKLNRI